MAILDPPRAVGIRPEDVTSFKAGQWNWSLENLPNVSRESGIFWKSKRERRGCIFGADCVGEQILYMPHPRPYKAWEDFGKRRIPYLLDTNAKHLYERWPDLNQPTRKLRFFPILHGIDVVSPQNSLSVIPPSHAH